jgi:CBS domain-containing protein
MTTKLGDLTVGDLMTRNVVSIRANEPLSTAAKLMWDHDCGVLPVLESEGERVLGMLTDRDICMATWSRNASPSAISAAEAVSRELAHCSTDDSILSAERTMRARQVRRLPVLDSTSRLAGILSLADIARAASQRSWGRPAFEVSPEQVVDTLAGIAAGRARTERENRPTQES